MVFSNFQLYTSEKRKVKEEEEGEGRS